MKKVIYILILTFIMSSCVTEKMINRQRKDYETVYYDPMYFGWKQNVDYVEAAVKAQRRYRIEAFMPAVGTMFIMIYIILVLRHEY